MQAGGIFLIGLGAITNQNHVKDPAGGSGKISGNTYIYAGLTAAMLGTLSFVAAGVHAGRAGHYLNSRGISIPLDNRRKKTEISVLNIEKQNIRSLPAMIAHAFRPTFCLLSLYQAL